MPFTPSHAIVALPFARTALPVGAVAIGAMSPDLPLFFPWAPDYEVLHGFPGLLLVTVPIALVLLLIWRVLLRPVAIELLPRMIAERLPGEWTPSAADGWFSLWGGRAAVLARRIRAALFLVLALALGVVTHVVWDLFTHEGRWGSQVLPLIAESWGPLPGTEWLQHASSVLGLVGLAVWGLWYLRSTAPQPRMRVLSTRLRVLYWAGFPVALLLAAAAHVLRFGIPEGYLGIRRFLVGAGTDAGALVLVGTGIAALIILAQSRLGRVRVSGIPEPAVDADARHRFGQKHEHGAQPENSSGSLE